MRALPATAVALALALVAAGAPSASSSERSGLRIREVVRDTGSLYTEGAIQFVSVRRANGHGATTRRLLAEVTIPRAPGRYRVRSWTRTCSGTCDRLDPPTLRCHGRVRVRAGQMTGVRVITGPGRRCRIRA